jgi:hypothetical protein
MDHASPLPAAVAGHEHPADFWSRFRVTFGPALVGLVGGGLTGGVAVNAVPVLLKNCAATYAKYPSLKAPWLSGQFDAPLALAIPLVLLGVAAPFAMGLATAWLVRAKDRWGDLSAGLLTGLTASIASYAATFGWMVILATVIVPSIADLTLFGNAVKTPPATTGQTAGHPSDVLAERYPDLQDTPPDQRGGLFFPKIVADQVVGSAYGVWLGIALSLATCGQLGLCGTLVGGWLLRRGGGWRSIVVPYGELVITTGGAVWRLIAVVLLEPVNLSAAVLSAMCLVGVTALVLVGVVRRWHWQMRAHLALVWFLLLAQAGFGGSVVWPFAAAAYVAYGLLALMLVRQWLLHRQPARLATA